LPETTSQATEEYLQAIYTLQDEGSQVISARIAEFLHVSPAAVSDMLHRLAREDLVSLDDRRVALSRSGRAIAERVARRHRLAERMLVDLLGYSWWKTHEEAERIEHAMSDEMEERLMRVLGNPETCPHGNPMPGVKPRPTRPLESLPAGGSGVIERIPDQFEHEPGFLEYLDGVGLRPGTAVTLVAIDDASLRVAVDGKERGIRRDCGHKVLVAA
jgi:DtxR family Mn-dependent transcriptional regulator